MVFMWIGFSDGHSSGLSLSWVSERSSGHLHIHSIEQNQIKCCTIRSSTQSAIRNDFGTKVTYDARVAAIQVLEKEQRMNNNAKSDTILRFSAQQRRNIKPDENYNQS